MKKVNYLLQFMYHFKWIYDEFPILQFIDATKYGRCPFCFTFWNDLLPNLTPCFLPAESYDISRWNSFRGFATSLCRETWRTRGRVAILAAATKKPSPIEQERTLLLNRWFLVSDVRHFARFREGKWTSILVPRRRMKKKKKKNV